MIGLRVLTSDDWKIWRELRLASLVEAPDAFGARLADWRGEGDREERWRSRLEIPDSHNIVALLDGTPAGMVSGVPTEQNDVAELITMWVSPPARGRGVGDFLIREVERWAAQRGAAVLQLSVAPGNLRADTLYRRNGFLATGTPGEPLPGDAGWERRLAKRLVGQHPAG
ncbi:GNAT family N-acetyltransferase [Kitasatospora sp. NPDC056138]|uniref:GNAT family N-acetyltransferase n=1 Tax=Kitasatospora sp. NPDC056138 TaxID=3345724 RepID=UPI0035E2031A